MYRWVIGSIMIVGLLGREVVSIGPSPVLNEIIDELSISISNAGLLISIVNLLAAFIGIAGGTLIVRFGLKPIFSLGLFLISLGSLATILVENFIQLLLLRILVGLGFGLCLPVSGVIVASWFKEEERPLLNTVSSMLPYFGGFIVFAVSPFVYQVIPDWRYVISAQGISTLLAFLFWLLFGKENIDTAKTIAKGGKKAPVLDRFYVLWEEWKIVLKKKDVVLLSLAEMGDMWSFQLLNTYLVVYFVSYNNMGMQEASWLVSFFPVAGLIGGFSCGIWMGKCGKRKIFTWPFHIMIFCGTMLILFSSGPIRLVGIFLAGFGNAAWAPALYTLPMEFHGVTTRQVALIYGLVFSLGSLAAFTSPIIAGWMMNYISMQMVLMILATSSLFASIMLFLIKDTIDSKDRKMIKGACQDA